MCGEWGRGRGCRWGSSWTPATHWPRALSSALTSCTVRWAHLESQVVSREEALVPSQENQLWIPGGGEDRVALRPRVDSAPSSVGRAEQPHFG